MQVTSADGTVLPMFLTRRRDLRRGGDVPVLLYGYGGVGACTTPSFSPAWAVWLERGGMLAVASLRGGGEYGRAAVNTGDDIKAGREGQEKRQGREGRQTATGRQDEPSARRNRSPRPARRSAGSFANTSRR